MIRSLCLIILLLSGLLMTAHPVHISVTTIEYNEDKKGFIFGIKIFYDDLQSVVLSRYQEKLNIEAEKKRGDEICDGYVRDVCSFSVNGKDFTKKLKYVRTERIQEAVWVYYVLPFRDKVSEILLVNKILHDLYPDQKNLVIVKMTGFEKGFTLDKNNTECRITI